MPHINSQPNQVEHLQDGAIGIHIGKGQICIVDAADYEKVKDHRWCVQWNRNGRRYYAFTNVSNKFGKWTTLKLHRLLMNPPKGKVVDHKDMDGLNNRRANLRICTHAQNHWNSRLQRNNSSGVKGVIWHKAARKWMAQVTINGKHIYLGLFPNIGLAAAAYQLFSISHRGEYHRTK